MKPTKLYLWLFLITTIASICWGRKLDTDEARALFIQANQYYRDKQFAQAVKAYEKIIEAGFTHPVVLYNAGNAYYRLGETGIAVLMYEKARRLAPRDKEIHQNLTKIEPPINRPGTFFLLLPFKLFKQSFSLNEFILISEVLYFLLAGSIIATLLFARAKNSLANRFLKPLAVLFIIILIFTSLKIYEEQIVIQGVVTPDKAVVKSGPGEQFSEILILPAGTRFRQAGPPEEGWIRIRLPDGKSGYLNQQAYHII